MFTTTKAIRRLLKLNKRLRVAVGGCLGKGTSVLMYDLTHKPVETIEVGDKLMGPDGKPRNVLQLYRGKSPLFNVQQKKGMDYVVNDKHILVLEDQGRDKRITVDGKRRYAGRIHEPGLHKMTAVDFFNGTWKSTIRRYKGIKAGLNFRKGKVSLDPYYLGLWLGDGCSRNASITNIDSEVLDYLFEEIPEMYDVVVAKQDSVTTKIIKKEGKYNDIIQRLKGYDLILNKHIPTEYIKNNRETRLGVLAGLIDSDGSLSRDWKTGKPKGYYITQKRKQLSDDIVLLSRTLGYYTTQHAKIASMKREDGSIYKCEVYVVGIFPQNYSEIPVKVARKQRDKVIANRNVLRSGIKLEALGIGDYYGFELDGDHLFLLEDLTITHNTSAGKTIAIVALLIDQAQRDKTPTLTSIVSESFPHLKRGAMRDFLNIMKEQEYYKDAQWNRTDYIYTFETGSTIEFFSADQSSKVRGPRRQRLFINEANNIPFDTFEQLEVRTSDYIYLDWNPVSEFWYYTDLKPARGDEINEITLTYKDNEALPESVVKSIEARRTRRNWWRVFGMGLLGEVENRIYKDWAIIDEVPHEARLECYGLDWGYSLDPTAIVAVYYHNGGYILDEVTYQKGLSNKEVADILKNQEAKIIIADSAEPKSIDEVRSFGLGIIAGKKGKDSVKFGIHLVQDQRISVTKRSINLIREFRNYLWQRDRKTDKIINEPEGGLDHLLDALRYALTYLNPKRVAEIRSKEPTFDKIFARDMKLKKQKNNINFSMRGY